MSKRNNVAYIKPEDPKFLQQLKAQIGYQSGPSIDSKVTDYLSKPNKPNQILPSFSFDLLEW